MTPLLYTQHLIQNSFCVPPPIEGRCDLPTSLEEHTKVSSSKGPGYVSCFHPSPGNREKISTVGSCSSTTQYWRVFIEKQTQKQKLQYPERFLFSPCSSLKNTNALHSDLLQMTKARIGKPRPRSLREGPPSLRIPSAFSAPFPEGRRRGMERMKGIDFETGQQISLLISSEIETAAFSACFEETIRALVVSCFSECGPEDPQSGHGPRGLLRNAAISDPTRALLSQDPHFLRTPGDAQS